MINSYRELENKCKQADKAIYNTAVRSAFKNTMEAYKEIERLTREKIAYINTKVIVDQALATLKRGYELEQNIIKGVKIEQLAIALNVNEQAIKARIRYQKEKLCEAILNIYSGKELIDIICDSEWLMNRYKREIKKTENGAIRVNNG